MAKDKDGYGEQEAHRRFEATLRGALMTPAKPHDEMKVRKDTPKRNRGKIAEQAKGKPGK